MLILFLQTSNFRINKLCCMCLKTTKQWSIWLSREEVRQWDTFPEPTELLLIDHSIESIWTPKSKSNILTPKNNSQTCKPREISHVMSGIICWACLTLAIRVLPIVLKWCRKERKKIQVKKESQQSQDQWWIWLREAMKRAPSALSSIASESQGKTRHESLSILSPQGEKYDRTGSPVVCPQGRPHRSLVYAHSSSYSDINERLKHVSLVRTSFWKRRKITIVRGGPLFALKEKRINSLLETTKQNQNCHWDPDHSCTGWMTKCDKGKKSSTDATKDSNKHSVIWGMFMFSTLQAFVFMGKNYSDNWHSIKNTEDHPKKQKFDISEKLTVEQSDEIHGVKTINWENSSWKYLSLIGDEQVVRRWRTKVYIFSDFVLCLGKINENPKSNITREDRLTWFKSSREYRDLDKIDGEPIEFEWNIFPGFTTFQLCHKVQKLLLRLNVTPENFTGRIIFMSMFNDISLDQRTTRKNAIQMLISFPYLRKDSEQDNGHSSHLGQRKSGILLVKIVDKVNGTKWRKRWWWHSQKAHTQSSEPRVPCPEVSLKAKVVENCRSTIVPTRTRLQLFFAQLPL